MTSIANAGRLVRVPSILSIALTGGVVTGIAPLDQLHEPTLDGAADENNRENCVFTCDAMLSRFNRPDLNADGDAIKDSISAYGQGYVGFASQDTIIRSGVLEARWGIHSWRLDAPNRAALLAQLVALADAGTPSIVTIPSQWGSQPSVPGYNPDAPTFYTHACVYAGQLSDGRHVLVNPWGGFLMYYTSAELELRLCYLCAYPVVKATGGGNTVSWHRLPDGRGQDGRGHVCGTGVFAYLDHANLLGADGLADETYVDDLNSVTPLDNQHVVTVRHNLTPAPGQDVWQIDERPADAVKMLLDRRAAAEANAADLARQLADKSTLIAALNQQIDELKQQLANVAALSPVEQDYLALGRMVHKISAEAVPA